MREILIVTGEASGDAHGAALIRELRKRDSSLSFLAVGSEKMAREGAHILFDVKELSVMGLTEVTGKIITFILLFRRIKKFVKEHKPAMAILIDSPDFNLRVAAKIRKVNHHIPIVYYISPTIWAWRYRRVEIIRKYITRMLVTLPFEEQIYKKENIPCRFVGHPVIDELKSLLPSGEKKLNPLRDDFKIAIMPGSRRFEIKLLKKPLREASAKIKKRFPETRFIVVRAPTIDSHMLEGLISGTDMEISERSSAEVLLSADAAIVKSGTSTLETGLMATPMVIVYRFSWLTYFLARFIIRLKKQPFGLVNIIAGKPLVKELFQNKVTGEKISSEIIRLLTDKNYYDTMSTSLFGLRKLLETPGASKAAAEEIEALL